MSNLPVLTPPATLVINPGILAVIDHYLVELASRKYGWHTRDSLPLRSDSAEMVRFVFSAESPVNIKNVPSPDCVMDASGVVSLSFKYWRRRLQVEFPCMGVVVWSKVHDDAASTGTARGDNVAVEMNEVFDWLMNRRQKESAFVFPVLPSPRRKRRK